MNFYKDFFKLTFEICFAVFIIIFSYTLWTTFDKTSYETSKYYDNINEFELYVESDTNRLYVHNIGEKKSIAKLSFKTKRDTLIPNNITIIIDNKSYFVRDLKCLEDDFYCYYIINDITLDGYETKEFKYIIINDNIDYELVATI